jgi:hypothetical protein
LGRADFFENYLDMRQKEVLETLDKWGFRSIKINNSFIRIYRGAVELANIETRKGKLFINGKPSDRKDFMTWIREQQPPQLSLFA